MSQADTLDSLRLFIEHAPKNPGPLATDLRGWMTSDHLYVCAHCAGRIMSRGCQIPSDPMPVFSSNTTVLSCCLCQISNGK